MHFIHSVNGDGSKIATVINRVIFLRIHVDIQAMSWRVTSPFNDFWWFFVRRR